MPCAIPPGAYKSTTSFPGARAGGDQPDNLITLCMYCHAVIHGTRFPDMPDWMDQAELSQAAVEYVADHYAGSWWPWAKNYMEMREGG